MTLILHSHDPSEAFVGAGGGKASNLQRLVDHGFVVPPWFCISHEAFAMFLRDNGLAVGCPVAPKDFAAFAADIEARFVAAPLPAELSRDVRAALTALRLDGSPVAVRSSGLDEDSAENSFAGQFSSFLFQRGSAAIERSIKLCWASAFSERALSYRHSRGLSLDGIRMGVVVQTMVDAELSGVAFSRNPVRPLDRQTVIVDAVYGLGEGLVSGELDADHFEVHRTTRAFTAVLAHKTHALRQAPAGGLVSTLLPAASADAATLSDRQVREITALATRLEDLLGAPQDCEWAIANDTVYCLQTRPITTLPPEAFYVETVNGQTASLWDNSNIIESYSGVTSPLTFSFASRAYEQVYLQFCEMMGVPRALIADHAVMFRNMLGLVRGRIYYNLINWYRLIMLLPGSGSNQGFMETMMGVRQGLKPEVGALFDFVKNPPRYGAWAKARLFVASVVRFIRIDSIIGTFNKHFDSTYQGARQTDFRKRSLPEQLAAYQHLDEQLLRRWLAPIINDYLCMVFYGALKKLTESWLQIGGDQAAGLQNDLLCGQGDLESVEPTKMLMRIAAWVDQGEPTLRAWLLATPADRVWEELTTTPRSPELLTRLRDFLDRYGFRCVNELKLEEPDLHDNPSFAIGAIASYVRMKSYMLEDMEKRERAIRTTAEDRARLGLNFPKRLVFFWILRQARRAVRNRENLRFARTKIFGIVRHLFRAVGANLAKLGAIHTERDVFYLTVEEIFAYVEGRSLTTDLTPLVAMRKKEFDAYARSIEPPARFITYGAVAASSAYPMVLADGDLLRNETPVCSDPLTLMGTPCCPGIVEGIVRVAMSLKDTENLDGEILVTGRTDPGWVPLYPACSGLLIERGSLLSHSAVVARELGLPTIVGISGGLMDRLKTGMRVRVDAGKGEVRILS